jgi:signal transduction histidine kinase/ActR/RegA family two-component response regulator
MSCDSWYSGSLDKRKIPIHPFSLSFTGDWHDLEQKFLFYAYTSSLSQIRFALLLGCFLFAITGAIDAYLIPDHYKWFWVIRYAIVSPMLLALFAFSFCTACARLIQPLLALCLIGAASGLIAMLAMAPDPVQQIYHTCLLLAYMIGYTTMRLRFLWGSLAGWITFAIYIFTAIAFTTLPPSTILSNILLFFCANLVGMTGCYVMEYFSRRNFFLTSLLRETQDRIQATNLQLEERVTERTMQLMKANTELTKQISSSKQLEEEKENIKERLIESQKLEAIGMLAGGIAHDFNNSLGAILGYTDLGKIKSQDDEELTEYFSSIRKAGLRARDLVSQISAISWNEESHTYAIELKLIIKEALKFLQASLPPSIEISHYFDSELGKIMVDPAQAHQVFMTICTNRTKAMGDAGGKLKIHLQEIEVDQNLANSFSGLKKGAFYQQLSISDTGPEINTAKIEYLFDPSSTYQENLKEHTLGFTVIQSIMQRLNGTVNVESEPGRGTTFHLFFPSLDKTRPFQEVPAVVSLPMGKGNERILLVDDEEPLVNMGERMLHYLHYKVTGATSSAAALNYFSSSPNDFDLVITDMAMPNMTGAELAQKMMTIRPKIPIILCTGYAKEWNEEKALALGFRAFVHKPLSIHKLAETIRSILDNR